MTHTILRLLLIVALINCLLAVAQSQSPAVISNRDGSVTVDAARLNTIVSLDSAWRYSLEDHPNFSDPNFDDTSWPLIKSGGLIPAPTLKLTVPGKLWLRLHVQVENANGPLAVILTLQNRGLQYRVFANGISLGATKDFGSQLSYLTRPFPIDLPQQKDLVLAIAFIDVTGSSFSSLPLSQIAVGQSQAIASSADLKHYRDFEYQTLADIIIGLLFTAFVPIGITLYLARPDHPEYLWLAISCFFLCIIDLISPAKASALIPSNLNPWMRYLTVALFTLFQVTFLEFLKRITGFQHGFRLRLIQFDQIVQFIGMPLFHLYASGPAAFAALLIGAASVVVKLYITAAAFRRGNKECGFLCFSFVLELGFTIAYDGNSFFPSAIPEMHTVHLGGGIFFSPDIIADLTFLAVLMAVVLCRFRSVVKDEQSAATELEAARTVQQLLIPSQQPATPGFIVESVYLPARQVGGDFFLILPAPNPSVDLSLLAVMGDVSGKGLQAAMVVSTIIGALRMQLSRQPVEVLTHLNRVLTGNISGFATCCAILIHPDGRTLLANAGNPSPYCDGVELPASPGLPLGLAADVAYDESEFTFARGARLTFVSDGVVEATSFPRKELFGFDRTCAASTQSAAAIAEAAYTFGKGAPQADDITVLTITLGS